MLAERAENYIQQVQMDDAQSGNTTHSQQRKRDHKASIRRRLMEN